MASKEKQQSLTWTSIEVDELGHLVPKPPPTQAVTESSPPPTTGTWDQSLTELQEPSLLPKP